MLKMCIKIPWPIIEHFKGMFWRGRKEGMEGRRLRLRGRSIQEIKNAFLPKAIYYFWGRI